ncbi:helix-turn-helix domain-containing protein [Enterococcus sp. DIV0756]
MKYGNHLEKLRKKKEFSQLQLAEKTGISRSMQ